MAGRLESLGILPVESRHGPSVTFGYSEEKKRFRCVEWRNVVGLFKAAP